MKKLWHTDVAMHRTLEFQYIKMYKLNTPICKIKFMLGEIFPKYKPVY